MEVIELKEFKKKVFVIKKKFSIGEVKTLIDVKKTYKERDQEMPYSFGIYEEEFNKWKEDTYPDIKEETKEFLKNLLFNEKQNLWRNQKEAVLRAVYCYEVLKDEKKMNNLLLNIVTGGGKTLTIASIIAWLKMAHDVNKFIIITPNTIVRDRIKDDFIKPETIEEAAAWKSIFVKSQLLPKELEYKYINDLGACVLESGSSFTNMLSSGIIICNIQQIYCRSENLSYIIRNMGSRLCIINDEAHNTCAEEYTKVLHVLSEKTVFRLDTTATPTRADGKYPNTEMVYSYGISEALSDKIIKDIEIYEPDVKIEEMVYINYETGEKRHVSELSKEFEEAEKGIKPLQWVLDDIPMRKHISFALDQLKRQDGIADNRYNPLLFVVTMSIKEGERVKDILINEFKVPTLLVTEETSEKYRDVARKLGQHKEQKDYKAVVSVMMLKEGWDVPQVSCILLLRKFSSPVYGQQVIGRGLRRIIRSEVNEKLFVIDHPSLKHDWLWKKFYPKAQKVKNIGKGKREDEKQEPRKIEDDLRNIVNEKNRIPKLNVMSDDDFLKVLYGKSDFEKIKDGLSEKCVKKEWEKILDSVEYKKDKSVSISRIKYSGYSVMPIRSDRKKEILYTKDKSVDIAKQDEITDEELREKLKKEIHELCFNLSSELGYMTKSGLLYDVMIEHISKKIFKGKNIYDADIMDVRFAIDKLKFDILNNFDNPVLLGIFNDHKHKESETSKEAIDDGY